MSAYDGFFEIILKDNEGIFLKIYPKERDGEDVSAEQIITYLEKKNIKNYNIDIIKKNTLKITDKVEFKISDDLLDSIDENYDINISNDKLYAFIRFYPPVGKGKSVSKEQIVTSLNKMKIINGIDMKKIELLIDEKEYNMDYVIVNGQKAIEGKDAVIHYYFSEDTNQKPKINKDGSVDFHKLNIIQTVKENELIAELDEAIEGENGADIFGKIIKCKKVKKLKLSIGKNVYLSEDKTKAYASLSGNVKLDNGTIIVDNQYEVAHDVDSSTGDIEFEGTVIIKGNVRTGFTVKAIGDIEIFGVVEGAQLISQGQIILHRGIQGMGKGVIECKSNIISKFIENSKVKAGGYIHSEAILHSQVIAKKEIIVQGKKGVITGGEIRSGKGIITKILGSHMGTITTVEVGTDPELLEENNDLMQQIKDMKDELVKSDQVISLLKKKQQQETLDQMKIEMLKKATRNKIFLNEKISKMNNRLNDIQAEISSENEGNIKVQDIAYTGVRICISNVRYYIRDEIKYSTLYRDGSDIKITSFA